MMRRKKKHFGKIIIIVDYSTIDYYETSILQKGLDTTNKKSNSAHTDIRRNSHTHI